MLRVGRKVGRTIYRQEGDEPADTGPRVGVMDTPALASAMVDDYNGSVSKADAWDEGWTAGFHDEDPHNPYRET